MLNNSHFGLSMGSTIETIHYCPDKAVSLVDSHFAKYLMVDSTGG